MHMSGGGPLGQPSLFQPCLNVIPLTSAHPRSYAPTQGFIVAQLPAGLVKPCIVITF